MIFARRSSISWQPEPGKDDRQVKRVGIAGFAPGLLPAKAGLGGEGGSPDLGIERQELRLERERHAKGEVFDDHP